MPTHFSGSPMDRDPRRWQACLDKAAAEMVMEGWNRHARKFWTVQHRRATRIWRGHL